MAWFRCFIHGENFPSRLLDEAGPVGFFVTRFVEARSAEAAEMIALEQLRAEPRLARPPGFKPNNRAKVWFKEIEEIAAADVPEVTPGFVWFPMDGGESSEE